MADLPRADRERMATQVLRVHFPGWTPVSDSPRPAEAVVIVPYDAGWAAAYASWERRLREVLGPAAQRVDHVGSTSVYGLAAKPVTDIQVSVERVADESLYAAQLGSVGVPLRNRNFSHRYFCPPPTSPRTVQIHVCQSGSAWERDHLLFRDYLRAQPSVRQDYAQLKRELALVWGNDRLAYADAKTNFILDALSAAATWAAAAGWRAPEIEP